MGNSGNWPIISPAVPRGEASQYHTPVRSTLLFSGPRNRTLLFSGLWVTGARADRPMDLKKEGPLESPLSPPDLKKVRSACCCPRCPQPQKSKVPPPAPTKKG